MRQINYTIAGILFVLASASLGYTAWQINTTPKLLMSIDQPILDAGTVAPDSTIDHIFSVFNNSSDTINIDRCETNCGCTVAEIMKRVLTPHQSTTIHCIADLRGRRGQFTSGFTLWYHDSSGLKHPLVAQVKCAIDNIIILDKSRLFFDDRKPATDRIVFIKAPKSVKLLNAVSSHASLHPHITDDGTAIEIAFTPEPAIAPGIKLAIHVTTNCQTEPMFTIPVIIGHIGP
jgi:hypothetical protein